MKINITRRALTGLLTLLFTGLLFSPSLSAQKLEGIASYYGKGFHGKSTSTGEKFNKNAYSAASLDMPWGTVLEVTNLANGRTTQVRVNDCGPHVRGRLIDLSRAAAADLGFLKEGEAKVRLRIIQASTSGPTCSRGAWSKKLKARGEAIPPPPPPWDPTQTVSIEPVNPVVPGPPAADPAMPVPKGALRGRASYYADRFQGRPTSTGETYDAGLLTAASKTFPYGSMLEVTNIVSGAKVTVKVNDCGPNSPDRILDLSRAAAAQIGVLQAGIAVVDVRVLRLGSRGPTCNRAEWLRERQAANTTMRSPEPRPATETSPAPVPDPSPMPAGSTLVDAYQVQVGAFGNRANAEKVVMELLAKGFPESYTVTSGKLTRVFTGVSATEAEAEAVQAQLVNAGYPKTKVEATKVTQELISAPEPEAAPVTYGATPNAPREFAPDEILFGVQVGAFGSEANADKTMKALRAAGFTEVYSAAVGKTTRVFSGKYYFQNQAEAEKERLRKAGFAGASVRRVQ